MTNFNHHLTEVSKENGFEDMYDMLSKVNTTELMRISSEAARRFAGKILETEMI